MSQDLKTLISPIDEAGRAKRTQAEHKILDRILKDLDDSELDHAAFRHLMHDYCELKKQDNIKEKNVVLLAIAESRLSRPSRLRADHNLSSGPTPDSIPAAQDSGDSSTDASECQLSTVNCQLSPADPDIDPEWSLAPWGRRKNGKPRTENEYRTILYRAVRDVYGLDLHDHADRHRHEIQTNHFTTEPLSAQTASQCAPTHEANPSQSLQIPPLQSEPRAQASDESPSQPHDPEIPLPPTDAAPPSPPLKPKRRFQTPPLRSPPGFCGEVPFDPKPQNPWYYF